MSPHALTNFEIQRHYPNEHIVMFIQEIIFPTFTVGECVKIYFAEYIDIGTHLAVIIYIKNDEVTYFNILLVLGVKRIPKEI